MIRCLSPHHDLGLAALQRSLRASLPVLVCLFLFAACEGPTPTTIVEPVAATTPVTLGAGDVVRITFTAAPDFNQTQKIRSDGRISLPQLGEVTAAGKTLARFQSDLKSLYSEQIKNTDVVVTLDSAVTQIYLSGSVRSPGKLTFERPTTVLQAIMEAGGINQFGNLRKVHLIRTINGVQRTQVLDLRPAIRGATTQAFYVKNGDIVQVPQSAF